MPDIEDVDGRWNGRQSVERLDSHLDIRLRKRADSISVITVDTADLDCQFTRPDQEGDKMIEEERSKTGKVQWSPATPLIRRPRYNGHFILARTKAQSVIFLFKEPL